MRAGAGFDAGTVFLAMLPLGHNYNLASPGMLGVFHAGGTVVDGQAHGRRAGVPGCDRAPRRHRGGGGGAADHAVAERRRGGAHDLRSLRVVQNGGARLAPELRRRIRQQWGATPQEIYGTAEGLINMTRLDDPDELLFESSGAPVCDDDEIKVVDDDGREVPTANWASC